MKIKLKDSDEIDVEEHISAFEAAKLISPALARNALACSVNGKVCGLDTALNESDELLILTFDDLDGRKVFWHTASHVLAQAVKRLYPDVKLTIGPSIDNGFYYDFDSETSFTPVSYTHLDVYKRQL